MKRIKNGDQVEANISSNEVETLMIKTITEKRVKKIITMGTILIGIVLVLYLISCNQTGINRNDIVSAQINGKLKECYCRVQFVKANGIIQLHCENDSIYSATRLQVVKCDKEFNYKDWFPVKDSQ